DRVGGDLDSDRGSVPGVRRDPGGLDRGAARRRRHAHAADRLADRLLADRVANQPVAGLPRRLGSARIVVGLGRGSDPRRRATPGARADALVAASRAIGDRRRAGGRAGRGMMRRSLARRASMCLAAFLFLPGCSREVSAASWIRSTMGAGGAFTQASADGDTVWGAADLAGFYRTLDGGKR